LLPFKRPASLRGRAEAPLGPSPDDARVSWRRCRRPCHHASNSPSTGRSSRSASRRPPHRR